MGFIPDAEWTISDGDLYILQVRPVTLMEFQDKDIPKQQAEGKAKTPSQRLRAVMYIWYQQSNRTVDFEVFYREKMEKLIDFVKGKLF